MSTDPSSPSDSFHWGEIDGVSIDFPMTVRSMNSATLTYTVPIAPAQELLTAEGFAVAEVAPNSAMLVLALVDYIDNPWGDYDEVNFGLLVHPSGRGDEVGAFQWRMPVNQEMTCRAGNEVLGLPKTVEEVSFDYGDDHVSVQLATGGSPTIDVRFPRAAPVADPTSDETLTYSVLDGVPTVVPLTIELPTGLIDPSMVEITLGDTPAAVELRSLGLPATPDIALWGEGLSGTFHRPAPV